jgi:putative transposase
VAGVSRSGYYKWLSRCESKKDNELREKIRHEYHRLKGIYGYRRMKLLLERRYGVHVNHKRVYRLMRQMGMLAVIRRKKPYTVYSKDAHEQIPNTLNRDFTAEQPNKKWVTDITYLTVNGQKMFLSAVLDLFNNEIVAYQMGRHPSLDLVTQTIELATSKRKVNGVLLHSDQGSQYTCKHYISLLQSHGIIQSMSRRGNCLDNAVMENFFGHLKSELLYNQKISTVPQLIHEIEAYMHFYNYERIQTKLRGMTPVEYRNHTTKSA